ncbi:MAG TPA: hypothetical protein VKV32_13045 [Stellaceae bacterium]|nr:hypothetical protein [Stellaceae bacterium]
MNYTDILFILLFACVCVLCRFLRPWPSVREWTLIAVSLAFVASWGSFSLALLLAIAAANFAAVALASRLARPHRRVLVGTAILFDVAALALFKYADFAILSLEDVTGARLRVPALGLPLGISFYTFHLISYLVDWQRQGGRPLSLRRYLFYLTFFPHAIAGPIVRIWQLPSQLGRDRRLRGDLMFGIHYFVVGFFLKAVVSNNLAEATDPFWVKDPGFTFSAADHWIVAFLYYCQIYGDFAGSP